LIDTKYLSYILITVGLYSTTLAYFKLFLKLIYVKHTVYYYYSRTFYIFYHDYMIMWHAIWMVCNSYDCDVILNSNSRIKKSKLK